MGHSSSTTIRPISDEQLGAASRRRYIQLHSITLSQGTMPAGDEPARKEVLVRFSHWTDSDKQVAGSMVLTFALAWQDFCELLDPSELEAIRTLKYKLARRIAAAFLEP